MCILIYKYTHTETMPFIISALTLQGHGCFQEIRKSFILLLGLLLTSALHVNRYIPTLLNMPQGV